MNYNDHKMLELKYTFVQKFKIVECTLYMHLTKKQCYISLKNYNNYYFNNNTAMYVRFAFLIKSMYKN